MSARAEKSEAVTPAPTLPPRGETHVWFGGTTAAEPERDLALLPADERERALRHGSTADRARCAAAWAGTRRILARYLGADPAALRLERTGAARWSTPGPDGTPVHLSVARADGSWLLALAVGDPVGADLERIRPLDTEGLAAHCLAPEERSWLAGLPDGEHTDAFLRAWTRKEALRKAADLPRTAPRHLPVAADRPGPVTLAAPHPGDGWTVDDLPAAPDERAALARPAHCTGPLSRFHATV
ncbi:4'-phosphopantetheinyl transferase family protein [Kitasatospora sp. NPDC048365]|uniref:4'-phosphopantetheinyl transferase family protein n=1 Tax=Kitasatospora sp. NPDC048365 TaxID=3364050 RepID=UPI003715914F